eukprot:TRINITY_DN1998_c0_g1_i1.p1 TRINITY_DN1998_c0_g1~~TRINITY_DN1998_c0_g1_i1.p1  ORF type:complete len:192 (+),score=94.89 TRINITY_DN1998_c0_g1_i1:76-651(+)
MFGVIIPGRAPLQFNCINSIEQSYGCNVLSLPNQSIQSIREFTFFLTQPLPENFAAILFLQIPFLDSSYFSEWGVAAVVTNQIPSVIVHLKWTLELISNLIPNATLNIGIKISRIETIATLKLNPYATTFDETPLFAKGIAFELFNYLQSFAKQTPQGELVILEAGVVDRWFKRFEQKWQFDPNFWRKNIQ